MKMSVAYEEKHFSPLWCKMLHRQIPSGIYVEEVMPLACLIPLAQTRHISCRREINDIITNVL